MLDLLGKYMWYNISVSLMDSSDLGFNIALVNETI